MLVRDPPVFSPRPQPQYHGHVGEEVTLVCGGQGSPSPEVTWKRVRCTGIWDVKHLDIATLFVFFQTTPPVGHPNISYNQWRAFDLAQLILYVCRI